MTINLFLADCILIILGLAGLTVVASVAIQLYFSAKMDFVGKLSKAAGEALTKANEANAKKQQVALQEQLTKLKELLTEKKEEEK